MGGSESKESNQSVSTAGNFVRQGNNEIPSTATTIIETSDLPKYEGVPDPVPVIASALSYEAKSFEPKRYRENSISETQDKLQDNNNVTETETISPIINTTTDDHPSSFSSDKNENIIPVNSSLSPSKDETDKSIQQLQTTTTTTLIVDDIISSVDAVNIVNNNNTIKVVEHEFVPTAAVAANNPPQNTEVPHDVEPVEVVVDEAEQKTIVEANDARESTPVVVVSQQMKVEDTQNETETETNQVEEQENDVLAKSEVPSREVTPEQQQQQITEEVPKPAAPLKSAASRSMDKSLIKYDEDQWSPANPEGKKKYSMLQLRELCKSELVKKPELPPGIANALISSGKPMGGGGGGRMYNNPKGQFNMPPGLMPSFASGGGGGGGGRGNFDMGGSSYNKRSSQQGNKNSSMGKNNSRGGIPQRPSLRQLQPDVKLNEAENAWKPKHLQADDARTPEERDSDDIYRKFRSIMNKLTPENFDTLHDQLIQLNVNTSARLVGCMKLVFEKAIAEPNYSRVYAEICRRLSGLKPEDAGDKKVVTFKSNLLNQCQSEFEKHKQDSTGQSNKKELIQDEKDEVKRGKMKEEFEEQQYKLRHRAIGTVRFIGELYKIDMLNDNIMHQCVSLLLENGDEDSLECLCKLLSTIGKKLEQKSQKCLDPYFQKLESIVKKTSQIEVSSRIRFAIQDVIDLKRSKWQPRRNDQNPKTMGQIQREAEQEHRTIEMMNYMTPNRGDKRDNNRDDNRRGGSMTGGNKYNNNKDMKRDGDGGWITQGSKSSRPSQASFDLKNIKTFTDQQQSSQKLGPTTRYQDFFQNRFAVLPTEETPSQSEMPLRGFNSGGAIDSFKKYGNDNNSFNSSSSNRNNHPQRQNSRENSRNRTDMNGPSRSYQAAPRQSSITGSIINDRNNDRSLGGNMGPSGGGGYAPLHATHSHSQIVERRSQQQPSVPAPVEQLPVFSEEDVPDETEEAQIKRTLTVVISEYLSNRSFDDFGEFNKIQRKYRWYAISQLLAESIDWKADKRAAVTELCLQTLKANSAKLFTAAELKLAVKQYIEFYPDLEMDCKTIADFTAEFLGPLMHNNVFTFRDLLQCSSHDFVRHRYGEKLLVKLFKYLSDKYEQSRVKELWEASKVDFKQFLADPLKVDKFISDHNLNYIVSSSPISNPAEIHLRLTEKFANKDNTEDIRKWIDTKVADKTSSTFIRAFMKATIEYCIETTSPGKSQLDVDRFNLVIDLLRLYLDAVKARELEALYAVQDIINEKEFPKGLLQEICNNLSEHGVISKESFIAWRDDTPKNQCDQKGKGVCMKSLNSFFTSLSEFSDESDEGDDAD